MSAVAVEVAAAAARSGAAAKGLDGGVGEPRDETDEHDPAGLSAAASGRECVVVGFAGPANAAVMAVAAGCTCSVVLEAGASEHALDWASDEMATAAAASVAVALGTSTLEATVFSGKDATGSIELALVSGSMGIGAEVIVVELPSGVADAIFRTGSVVVNKTRRLGGNGHA